MHYFFSPGHSVVNQHRFDADPDPDPNFHSDADPHAEPILSLTHVGKSNFFYF